MRKNPRKTQRFRDLRLLIFRLIVFWEFVTVDILTIFSILSRSNCILQCFYVLFFSLMYFWPILDYFEYCYSDYHFIFQNYVSCYLINQDEDWSTFLIFPIYFWGSSRDLQLSSTFVKSTTISFPEAFFSTKWLFWWLPQKSTPAHQCLVVEFRYFLS